MPELQITPAPTGPEAPPADNPQSTANTPPAGAAGAAERPSWLPEGMNSPEELAAAYAKLSQKGQTQEPEQSPEASPELKADASASKFVQDAGFDPVALSREIASAGDINPQAKAALVKKLEKAGLPAAMVDEYISGQRYAAQAVVNDIMAAAGGSESFAEMAEWAGANLDAAELKTFNAVMQTGNVDVAKMTVKNLYARYRQEAALPGKRVRGVTGGGSGDVFQSWEQFIDSQKDSRYARDPAYRADVERKLERTLKAGGFKHLPR